MVSRLVALRWKTARKQRQAKPARMIYQRARVCGLTKLIFHACTPLVRRRARFYRARALALYSPLLIVALILRKMRQNRRNKGQIISFLFLLYLDLYSLVCITAPSIFQSVDPF